MKVFYTRWFTFISVSGLCFLIAGFIGLPKTDLASVWLFTSGLSALIIGGSLEGC